MSPTPANPLGLRGLDFVAFASPDPSALHTLFLGFGFSRVARHVSRDVDLYVQNDIAFLLDRSETGASAEFAGAHGPSITAIGLRFDDPARSIAGAAARGAEVATRTDLPLGAIVGVGGSLVYFAPDRRDAKRWEALGFVPLERPDRVEDRGFVAIDHLTNNVDRGTMATWTKFYEDVFGFTQVRYFDIRGARTGLTSFALRSPCGTFCIPINEATDDKSQVAEFIEQYRGPGIQHLAFLTKDILTSLARLEGTPVRFLDIDDAYYEGAFARVPGVLEDRAEIRRRNVLVDGDEDGYLLQIFTQPLCGPIFIELIQRQNHLAFGEGNFGALFRSIEREQARRGVFDDVTPSASPSLDAAR